MGGVKASCASLHCARGLCTHRTAPLAHLRGELCEHTLEASCASGPILCEQRIGRDAEGWRGWWRGGGLACVYVYTCARAVRGRDSPV